MSRASVGDHNIDKFKVEYERAAADKRELFIFEGSAVLVSYAKYLIEFFDTRIKPQGGVMNHKEKMDKCQALMQKMESILDAKGRDYSGTEDAMSNFHDFGWRGILVRLGDKYHRCKNLSKKESAAAQDEAIEDTLLDMANYCLLALIEKEHEDNKLQTTTKEIENEQHYAGP